MTRREPAVDRVAAFAAPPGWIPLPSAVEGVVVWGPPPESSTTEAEAPRSVRCGGCGAAAAFDPGKGALACTFCGWVAEARPQVVGEDAPKGEFTRDALAPELGLGVDRRESSCGGCGAVMSLDATAMATTCPFCASNQVAIHPAATSPATRPQAAVPFAVRADGLARVVGAWLVRGWLHPEGLADLARVDHFVGVYVPHWAFSADLDSSWEAEVGTERREQRWNPNEKKHETEVVIDWRWDRGSLNVRLRDQLVPGTSRISDTLLRRLHDSFAADALAAYTPDVLAGFQAQAPDVGLADAWDKGRAQMRETARDRCRASISSRHVRNFSMQADLQDEAWRHVLLPVWVSAYRYEGRTFVVLVDGHGGAVSGQKPVAWWKVWTAVALFLSPGVVTAVISLPLLLVAGVGVVTLVLAFMFFVAGALGSYWVYRTAVDSEAA